MVINNNKQTGDTITAGEWNEVATKVNLLNENNSGNVGINTSTPTANLDVNGVLNATNITVSDIQANTGTVSTLDVNGGLNATNITATDIQTTTGTISTLTTTTGTISTLTSSNVTSDNIISNNKFVYSAITDLGTVTVNTNIDLSVGNVYVLTLGADINLTFTDPGTTQLGYVTLIIKQDVTGGRSVLSFPTNVKWAGGGTAPTITSSAGAVDIITMFWDGTNYYADITQDFQ